MTRLAKADPPSAPQRRGRGRPTLEDVAQIDNRLIAAALSEFNDHGYAGASMRAIANAAGVSRSTLLSRYTNKQDLFNAIMHRQIDQMAAATSLHIAMGRLDLRKGLEAYANRAFEFSFSSDLLLVNRLILSEAHRFPELGRAAAESSRLGIRDVSRFIRQCAETEGFVCKDPEAAAQSFIFMLRGWFVNAMLAGSMGDEAERKRWVKASVQTFISAWSDW